MSSIKQKVAQGGIWTLLEKLSVQFVSFGVGMVLARLLTPEDYGTVALTSIFFAVAGVLVDSGFGDALIQKKDADDLDANTVFLFSMVMAGIAYGVMFVAAPWIALFYHTPILVSVIRWSSLFFFTNAISSVQNAVLVKKMLFNLSFRISMITSIVSAACGVLLAYLGYGVWALVVSSLIAAGAGVIARLFILPWRPKLLFSWKRLKPLFAFGWKMAVSALFDAVFVHLNSLLIGKFYSKADLAYVNKGQALPQLAMNQVDTTLGRVSYPALVAMQDNHEQLRNAMRKMIQCSTFLVFPLMVGIAACSYSLLRLLFGAQWTPAAPYMMLACVSFALWPFHTINLRGIVALGRSDIFLKLEIVKKVAKLLVILVAFRYGVFAFMAVSAFALGPLSVLINAWPNTKLLNYSIRMQIMDVLPTAGICAIMAAVVFGTDYAFDWLGWGFATTKNLVSLVAVLAAQVVLGAGTFVALSLAFKLKPAMEYWQIAESLLRKAK